RKRLPRVPLAATFDMHANMHPRLGELLTVAGSYRTHPHLDMREVAAGTLERLAWIVEGNVQTMGWLENTGLLLPSINMRTSDGPMRRLQELAARAEDEDGILAVSVFGGFPYADAVHAGASAMVFSDAGRDADGALARDTARQLADAIRASREEFHVRLPSPREGIERALASTTPGLIGITDAADNPYSGGAADTPALLAALLEASPTVPCVFASFADADLVERARQAGIGRAFDARLGARHGKQFGEAVAVRVEPLRLTDGCYRGTATLLDGADLHLGPTVVLAVAGRPNIRILVTSRVDPGIDP